MAVTANYGWTKPTVGGDNSVWGGILNTAIDAIDSALKTIENLANARLPLVGGTMSGRVDLKTASMAIQNLGSISGALSLDLANAQYFIFTVGAALTINGFSNSQAGVAMGVITRITNGGAFVLTWPGSVKWVAGTAPTLTTAGVDLLAFITDDAGVTWRGLVLGKDIR